MWLYQNHFQGIWAADRPADPTAIQDQVGQQLSSLYATEVAGATADHPGLQRLEFHVPFGLLDEAFEHWTAPIGRAGSHQSQGASSRSWCAAPKIPASANHQNLRIRSRRLRTDPAFSDRWYHGLHLDRQDAVVVVEEHDGTRRLLRDAHARAQDVFGWGYGGSGPHALARVLVADALSDLTRCPDCFGAAPLAAGLIICGGCRNTGDRFWPEGLARQLVQRVITRLSTEPDPAARMDGADWTLTRQQLLTGATS